MKNYKYIAALVLSLSCCLAQAQYTVRGSFSQLAQQQVELVTFSGTASHTIARCTVGQDGRFALAYSAADFGVGQLRAENQQSYVVLLSAQELVLEGLDMSTTESVTILQGQDQRNFIAYSIMHERRLQCLDAWDYLCAVYHRDPLFNAKESMARTIVMERARVRAEDAAFLSALDSGGYLYYYLTHRKLISSVKGIAKYHSYKAPETIDALRSIDYSSDRFYSSGLLGDAVYSLFWLIEHTIASPSERHQEMTLSIDKIFASARHDSDRLASIAESIFLILEKHSLIEVSEYLAVKMLQEKSCTLGDDFASQLESYQAMQVGSVVSDIALCGDVYAPSLAGAAVPSGLSRIEAEYKVVVFGASWCPQCPQELAQLSQAYDLMSDHGAEILFVSLDTDAAQFKTFVKAFPFISTCDYQKWSGDAVRSWHVFATPTMYLLDSDHKIVLRATSADHIIRSVLSL